MIATLVVLAVTIGVMVWRPRGLAVGWPPLAGALVCVAIGTAGERELVDTLARTWNAIVALVGLMLLSTVLAQDGAFRAAARTLARLAGGSGLRLFLVLCATTAVAAVIVANDGAILLVTPIVAELADGAQLSRPAKLAYLFATGFLCDACSTLLPTSNLTNILLVDTLHVRLGAFVAHMALPSLAVLAVAVATLVLRFRRDLPRTITLATAPEAPLPVRSRIAVLAALAALAVGYAIADLVELPLGPVVLVVAVALAVVEHTGGRVELRAVVRALPIGVVGVALGLFVLVSAVANHGVQDQLVAWLETIDSIGIVARVAAVVLVVALLAALANNLPVFLLAILALAASHHVTRMPYAALLGANLGAKATPLGSLSTLLWLDLIRRHGVTLSWRRYTALALTCVIPALAAGILVLALT